MTTSDILFLGTGLALGLFVLGIYGLAWWEDRRARKNPNIRRVFSEDPKPQRRRSYPYRNRHCY